MGISRLPLENFGDELINDRLISVFHSLQEGMCITDEVGTIQYANKAFGSSFGISIDRIVGMPIQRILVTDIVKIAYKRKKCFEGEIAFHHRRYLLSVNFTRDNFGVKGCYIMSRELTPKVENASVPSTLDNPFPKVIGKNQLLLKALHQAKKAARKDVTVLLRGESGTGKELIAKQIHLHSLRADQPFVAINCAAIPENLIESELFGHEAGAFTGASGRKKGHFEMADGGTIFLDEIGDLPHHLQVKLLRVLQERVIRRVGGNQEIPINVRIITATHRDLEMMVEEKVFRRDLYYRLNVVAITLNPLRERRDDLEELLMFFLEKMQKRHNISGISLSSEAKDALLDHNWPGNIRELKNTMERAVIMVDGDVITMDDLPISVTNRYEFDQASIAAQGLFNLKGDGSLATLEEYEAAIIKHAVEEYGSFHAAGKILGINHKTVASKYRKLTQQ